jgi:hypothetical protein
MTQEEKNLLLKDLCSRLPFGVKVKHLLDTYPSDLLCIDAEKNVVYVNHYGSEGKYKIECIRPYLRPMETMTEEERKELKKLMNCDCVTDYSLEYTVGGQVDYDDFLVYYEESSKLIDWLNKNMFDYRGLIPMGLALEVKEEMIVPPRKEKVNE